MTQKENIIPTKYTYLWTKQLTFTLQASQTIKKMIDKITQYKKAAENTKNHINKEAKEITTQLKIDQKVNCLPEQQAFITIKDHKTDFLAKPTYRLINPTKTEIGKISKYTLYVINMQFKKTSDTTSGKTPRPSPTGSQP